MENRRKQRFIYTDFPFLFLGIIHNDLYFMVGFMFFLGKIFPETPQCILHYISSAQTTSGVFIDQANSHIHGRISSEAGRYSGHFGLQGGGV